jgi:hypothetical protein
MEPTTPASSSKVGLIGFFAIILIAAVGLSFWLGQRGSVSFTKQQPVELAANDALPELKEGLYALEGYNTGSASVNYLGSIRIAKTGEVYRLEWIIGTQEQQGVGLLRGDVLSVSYVDTTGESLSDVGVVTYNIQGDTLTGEWASFFSDRTGKEVLTYKSE